MSVSASSEDRRTAWNNSIVVHATTNRYCESEITCRSNDQYLYSRATELCQERGYDVLIKNGISGSQKSSIQTLSIHNDEDLEAIRQGYIKIVSQEKSFRCMKQSDIEYDNRPYAVPLCYVKDATFRNKTRYDVYIALSPRKYYPVKENFLRSASAYNYAVKNQNSLGCKVQPGIFVYGIHGFNGVYGIQ
jgi:hypothetical protein